MWPFSVSGCTSAVTSAGASAQVRTCSCTCGDKCALVPCTCRVFAISSPIHLIAAQSHRGIYEYAQAPECCNVKTGHLGLDLGQKLSKLSLKDHCSRDPVQVQSLYRRGQSQIFSNELSFVAFSSFRLHKCSHKCALVRALVATSAHLYTCPCTCAILHLCTCTLVHNQKAEKVCYPGLHLCTCTLVGPKPT